MVFIVYFVNLISNVVFFFRINLVIILVVMIWGSEGELNVFVWGSVWKLMLLIKKVVLIVLIIINIKYVGKIIY